MKRKAQDIMQRRLLTIDPDAKIPTLERDLSRARVGGLPVAVNGRLVGIVTLSDVVRRLCAERDKARVNVGLYGKESEVDYMPYDIGKDVADLVGERMDRLRVRDLMIEKVVTVSPLTPLDEIAELIVKHRINRIPVIDDGHLVGLVTGRDVIRAYVSDGEHKA